MKSKYVLYAEKLNERIQNEFEVFTDHGRDPNVTESKIETFLIATEGIEGFAGEILRRSDRLSLLGQKCIELGWDAMCQVYEFMVRTEPPVEQKTSLVIWYTAAFSFFLTDSSTTFEERCHVADDMCRIFNNALNVSPNDIVVAYSFGRLHLTHPLLQQDEVGYLKKAAEWFEAAETWSYSEESEEQAYEALCALSDTYFRLERWEDAFKAYKRLKLLRLKLGPTSVGDETDLKIDSRMAECESKLLS